MACRKSKVVSLIVLLNFIVLASWSQGTSHPVVGEKCPDLLFTDIEHYKTTQAHISDFRGKWLVIDIWGCGCDGCVKSFPRINAIQKDLRDKLEVLSVGLSYYELHLSSYSKVKEIYEKCRQRYGLTFSGSL